MGIKRKKNQLKVESTDNIIEQENNENEDISVVETSNKLKLIKTGKSEHKGKIEKLEKFILEKDKRYFGSSAASLTHQISNPEYEDKGINPALAKVGLEGERKTTEILKKWIKDKPSAIVIDSVHIKGHGKQELNEETGILDGGDTDHVLIINNVVIIIDSKNWKAKRKYTISEKFKVLRTGKEFPGGDVSTIAASFLWKKYLEKHEPFVTSIVCITTEKTFVEQSLYWWRAPYRLVTLENLESFLDEVWEDLPEENKNTVNIDLVIDILVNAIKPYDPVKEKMSNISHLLYNV